MNWLEEYLARCDELGIERIENGTREFIAWPSPKFMESGPENGSIINTKDKNAKKMQRR